MPQYKYQAIDDLSGKIIKDTVSAEDISGAAVLLRERGLGIISIDNNPVKEDPPAVEKDASAPVNQDIPEFTLDDILFYFSRVKKADITLFLKQMASLIAGGLSVVESLSVLEQQTTSRGLKKLIGAIRNDLEAGWPLSAALEKFPKNFPRFVTSIIKTGETSGLLDETMNEVVGYMEASAALRRQVLTAFFYPSIVLVVTIGVVFFMAGFVIPQIMPFIQMQGGQVPWNTQLLMDISGYVQENLGNIALGMLVSVILLAVLYKMPFTGALIDRYKMVLPVFGSIFQCGIVVHFSKTLHLLLSSGLPITEALRATAETISNRAVRQTLTAMSEAVLRGLNLSETMKKAGILFPPLVVTAVKVGEETGNIDRSLQTVTEMYGDLLQRKIKTMTAMIEPVLIIFLGGIIGFVVWGMIAGIMAGYGK
ncbi:type II secretion system F family protein [Peptococcaceae bacterium]|nr:type II secretion system F family protein [Peptococcaceae bacterium]